MRGLTRRRLLLGAGAVVAAGAAGTEVLGPDRVLHRLGLRASPDLRLPASGWKVETRTLASSALRRDVRWAIARPPRSEVRGTVLCLHGRGDDHRFAFDTVHVHDVVAASGAPLAVASVDGGADSYWHARADGTDAGAMVLDELLPELEPPVALLGWSMGGYGALLAAERSDAVLGVAAASPALSQRAEDTAPGAFDGPDDFAANDVFAGRPRSPVRIECGTHDPFLEAARAFAAEVHADGHFSNGYHDAPYWRSVAPAQVDWLAARFVDA